MITFSSVFITKLLIARLNNEIVINHCQYKKEILIITRDQPLNCSRLKQINVHLLSILPAQMLPCQFGIQINFAGNILHIPYSSIEL